MTNGDNKVSPGTGTIIWDLTGFYGTIINTPKNIVLAVNSTTTHTLLSKTRDLNNEVDLATLISSLIGEQFSISITKVTKISTQLEIYFWYCSILDEEILSITTDYSSWHMIRTMPQAKELPLVTVPVIMCPSNTARCTKLALAHGLCMTKTILYNDLVEWYGATKLYTSKIVTTGSTITIQ